MHLRSADASSLPTTTAPSGAAQSGFGGLVETLFVVIVIVIVIVIVSALARRRHTGGT